MLYMKEDDMDEMLRKAAANYDVDAGKAADWNAVFKAVHSTEEEFVPVAEKKKKRRFMFWWLLLIPLGWMANTMYNKFSEAVKTERKTFVKSETKLERPVEAAGNELSNDKTAEHSSPVIGPAPAGKENQSDNILSRNSIYKPGSKQPVTNNLASDDFKQQQSVNGSVNTEQHSIINGLQQDALQQAAKNADASVAGSNIDQPPVQQKNISSTLNADTAAKQNSVVSTSKASIKIPGLNNHFYVGLMAGMDLSFVKYQQMEPLGYNVGLLAGYKFRKLSIESGLYFVKKNYYTEGDYFDKSGISYFDDADILKVDGYCRMFEIPLNIKYNLAEKKHHTWFVTAGLSSYLMNKEYYNYDYIKDGEEHYRSKAYYHATQNWFSIVNLSAGYQLKTSTKTNLRIEPYFKAPLSGVGTGKLSISSVGINAGLVRQIP